MNAETVVEKPAGPIGFPSLLRDVFRGGLAGLIAGVIFLGLGSRVVMRVSALLNPEARGAVTDADAIVGEITTGGTLSLLFGLGIFAGLLVGAVWVIVREWLPANPWLRVPAAGIVAAAVGSFMVIAAKNPDFAFLDPPEAHIAMFVAIVGLAGAATAFCDPLLDRYMPSRRGATIIYGGLILLAGLPAVSLLVSGYFLEGQLCGCDSPPRVAGGLLIVAAIATVASWARYFPARTWSRDRSSVRPLGIAAVVGATLFGALDLAGEIDPIL